MNFRMDASESQLVHVHQVLRASRRTLTARFPSAALAWRALRMASMMNAGKYSHERTRRRVTETKGMNSSKVNDVEQGWEDSGEPLRIRLPKGWGCLGGTAFALSRPCAQPPHRPPRGYPDLSPGAPEAQKRGTGRRGCASERKAGSSGSGSGFPP